jgi:hypothetical protein
VLYVVKCINEFCIKGGIKVMENAMCEECGYIGIMNEEVKYSENYEMWVCQDCYIEYCHGTAEKWNNSWEENHIV